MKTILRLGDLLEGHTNQRKAEKKLMIMIYYSEKKQNKISKGKSVCRMESKRNQVQVFSYPLLVELYGQCFLFPATLYDNMCKVLSTREAYLSLGVQGFHWGSVT